MKKRISVLAIALVAGISMFASATINARADELKIEEDITSLRDSFTEKLGEKTYAGVSLVESELTDENLMALVTKHFNAVTLGNELKPDAMFGYSNKVCPELITYDLNGEEFTAPKMDFSRAERMLDYISDWNAKNPDKQIKVRGHVLVWHSQTPEWFFHENYDKKQPYVSPAEMDKRQEWYIKEVLEHFTGKYENLFYGWDVVNEAVSDATGTYRTDEENGGSLSDDTHGSKSSWWKVYQSNKYIINAFKYANMYAPEYVELYYNDYNECTPLKSNGIVKLIEDVKAADGTRLDGFGMQGHYDLSSPTGGQIKVAARRYAEVAGSVSLTELDLKASTAFDGTDEGTQKEYRKQYYLYKEMYKGFSELIDEGVDIRTITVWGVIDGNSWLQTQNNVGGAGTGKTKQCPLLFDDDYKAKPCFYALCDEPMPEVKVEKVEEVSNDTEVVEAAETTGEDVTNATEETTDVVQNSSESGNKTAVVVGVIAVIAAIGGVVFVKKRKK